jgi:steroid delta-isomerase-like uncharacterized protein
LVIAFDLFVFSPIIEPMHPTETIIRRYYDCFNNQDVEGLLELLSEDVQHEVSQGGLELGKATFRQFMQHMNNCYEETVRDLAVMLNPSGERAAAEFMLDGIYKQTDGTLPEASGQRYTLRVGAFFELRGGQIARVSNHYNIADWLSQVSE